MKGKTVVVTGANSGIGKVTALELARKGAHVVLMCRSEQRGTEALEDIRRESGSDDVELILLDLASLDSIQRAAEEFRNRHDSLDVLVNNAGVYVADRQKTVDGFEMTMGVNHIGTFHLTNLLLPALKAAAAPRVVTLSSEAHRGGTINFDDFFWDDRTYIALGIYGDSKLANILFANELARREPSIMSNSVHPGMVDTNLSSGQGWFGLVAKLSSPFLLTAEKGARTSIYLAASPEAAQVTGKYFARSKPRKPAKLARDTALAERLWTFTEQLLEGR